MSSFHVRAILNQRPELTGIIGQKKIRHLYDARVELIDLDFLDRQSPGGDYGLGSAISQYFIISYDGNLLGEVGVNSHGSFVEKIWRYLSLRRESIFEALQRVGIKNVAYVARFYPGSVDTIAPFLSIHKPEGTKTVDEHIQSLIAHLS